MYDAALEAYEGIGTDADVARVHGNRAAAYTGLGRPHEALDDFKSALAHHRAAGDVGRTASTLTNLGQLELGIGDLKSASSHLDEAIGLHRRAGSAVYAAFTQATRASCTRAEGDPDRAARELEAAESALIACGEPVLAAVARGARAMADLEDGRVEAALEGFESVLPTLEGRFEQPHAHYLMGYGEALARSGDPLTGLAMLRSAAERIHARDWPLGEALAHSTRARMLARAGQLDAAVEARDRATAVAAWLHAGPASPLGQDLISTDMWIAACRQGAEEP